MSDALTDAEWRELVAAAVEMSRKAKQEQQRAEEAEFHVEQLRDALDSAERIGERAAELATERDAALARIARTERLIDSWERDAPDHSNPVFIGRLRECLRRDPAPVRSESDDEFWGRLLGDDDPCAPGKNWAAAAFGDGMEPNGGDESDESVRRHTSPEPHVLWSRGDERCVVCSRLAPRHGGLCCSHKYDEQPMCAGCAADDEPEAALTHEIVDNGEDALQTCSACDWESWDTAPTFAAHACDHEWLDRPESDTRECPICGTEVAG